MLKEVKLLKDYPSGSGLAYLDNRIYLIGDDAANLLIMDTGFNIIDNIRFFETTQPRIEKKLKADLEAIAVIKQHGSYSLVLFGSGSLHPHRFFCWIMDPSGKEKKQYPMDSFYNRIKAAGIRELNIEGATAIPGGMIFANRGNRNYAKNHLIFTTQDFLENQDSADIQVVLTAASKDSSSFSGISGLDYSYLSDKLLMSVSTENTVNSYDDGTIGKSYLWIINDISSKKTFRAINPDKVINLEEMDERFKGHKIESVCIIAENRKQMELVLAADDDKGETILFKLVLDK